MRETYFATFLLGPRGGPAPAMEEILAPIGEWLGRSRSGVDEKTARGVDLGKTGDASLGSRAEVRVQHFTEGTARLFALRLSHPDDQEVDVTWRSEICVVADATAGSSRFSVSNSVGRRGSKVSPLSRAPSRPRLVPRMLQLFGAHEGNYALTASPQRLGIGGLDDFVKLLIDPDRKLPVVLVSARVRDDRPVLDSKRIDGIADQVAGLAHVFVAENRFPSLKLSDRLGKLYGCWDGAARIYWPSFRPGTESVYHPLWTPDRIAEEERRWKDGFPSTMLGVLSRSAINRIVDSPARWVDVEGRVTQGRISELRAKGDSAELVELFADENRQLHEKVKVLEAELAEANTAVEDAKRRADSWRFAYQSSKKEAAGAVAEIEALPPTTVKDAVERVMAELPDRLVLCLNSQSEYDDNEFEDVESVYVAVTWLATTYWLSKTGQAPCKDLDLSCRDRSGFFYRGGQSSVTMGKYDNFYKAMHGEREVVLAEHVGCGTSKETRYTIRIAFTFDASLRKVVIGFIGQHQKTDTT